MVEVNASSGGEQRAEVSIEQMTDADGTLVLRLLGELDLSNIDRLRPEIDVVIGGGPPALVIDLAGVTFMDSSGIALLIDTSQRIASSSVRNPSTVIRRIIEATGLSDVLRLEP
jgi:anti-anti-sigma factor